MTHETVINGTWSAPAVVIFSGDDAVVQVNGSARVGGGVAVIEISGSTSTDGGGEGTERRILVSATNGVEGAFMRVELKGQKRGADGKCYGYFAATQDQQQQSLSVLLVPREEPCKVRTSRTWIIAGVTMGVLGSLLILFGVLWVGRDLFQRWARGSDNEEKDLLV